jgi:hypothetical protein
LTKKDPFREPPMTDSSEVGTGVSACQEIRDRQQQASLVACVFSPPPSDCKCTERPKKMRARTRPEPPGVHGLERGKPPSHGLIPTTGGHGPPASARQGQVRWGLTARSVRQRRPRFPAGQPRFRLML